MLKFSSKPFIFHGFPLMEQALNLFRLAVEHLVRDLNNSPIIHGVHLEDIDFDDGITKRVYHKLGRIPHGWVITTIDDEFILYESARTMTYIDIEPYSPSSHSGTTASLWVF